MGEGKCWARSLYEEGLLGQSPILGLSFIFWSESVSTQQAKNEREEDGS